VPIGAPDYGDFAATSRQRRSEMRTIPAEFSRAQVLDNAMNGSGTEERYDTES
jgi:hypothetical protein